MEPNLPRSACTWADIKGRLDPAWSYVVIETAAASTDADVFEAVAALLAEHAAGIRAQEICRETRTGKLLMLVQVDPERTEAVKRSLLDPRLPPSMTVFCYEHAPKGSEG